ncbi:MAG: transposase [Candidatus Bathyanammoxibius sp.]
MSDDSVVCKYCGSDNVIKYGTYKGTQYYWCKDCKRKFANVDNIPKLGPYETAILLRFRILKPDVEFPEVNLGDIEIPSVVLDADSIEVLAQASAQ